MPDAGTSAAPPMLIREDRERVAVLTLNRPGNRNALSEAMLDALADALDAPLAIRADPERLRTKAQALSCECRIEDNYGGVLGSVLGNHPTRVTDSVSEDSSSPVAPSSWRKAQAPNR